MKNAGWQVWVDTGGTFTDCLAVDANGCLHRAKVLSSGALRGRVIGPVRRQGVLVEAAWNLPEGFLAGSRIRFAGIEAELGVVASSATGASGSTTVELAEPVPGGIGPGTQCDISAGVEASVLAAYVVTRTPLDQPLPAIAMRLATTRGTNALLERSGAPVALFITRGLGDLLAIGTQQRRDLFALAIAKPPPLYAAVVEVDERLAADGSVLQALQVSSLGEAARHLLGRGISCAAVALMHSFRNPRHEDQVASYLTAAGFTHVACSAHLAPLIKLLPRAETPVVDAYLAPVVKDYLARVAGKIDGSLQVMTSAGGLVAASEFRASDSLLSGPAGGVVGAAVAGQAAGRTRVVAFDMGGTSTDVARWEGDYEYVFEHQVGDAHLVAPALAIESVAAGGGSVCALDQGRLTVGPTSAGADPGPACYGAGGPLTLTDVNLLLGRLAADRFEIPIAPAAAEQALTEILAAMAEGDGERPTAAEVGAGFLDIANERMASAIRRISVRQGYDPAAFTLVAFGGAGPQHACAVAALLGMDRVPVPPDASLLSASGLGQAVVERFAHRQVLAELTTIEGDIPQIFAELAAAAREAVLAEGIAAADVVLRRRLAHLRLLGQETALELEMAEGMALGELFATRYRQVYGYDLPRRSIEVESLRVVASTRAAAVTVALAPGKADQEAQPSGHCQAHFAGTWQRVPVFLRARLTPQTSLMGPALIFEQHSTTVVEPEWQVSVDQRGALLLSRCREVIDNG